MTPRPLRHRRHPPHRPRCVARGVRGGAAGGLWLRRRSVAVRLFRPHRSADRAHGAERRRPRRGGHRAALPAALGALPHRLARNATPERVRVMHRDPRAARGAADARGRRAGAAHRQHRAGRAAEARRRGTERLLRLRRLRQRFRRTAPSSLPSPSAAPSAQLGMHFRGARRRDHRRLDLRRPLRRSVRGDDDRRRVGEDAGGNVRAENPRHFFEDASDFDGCSARSDERDVLDQSVRRCPQRPPSPTSTDSVPRGTDTFPLTRS